MSADDVFTIANWALVASLIVGVLATYAIVVSGKIRDEESKRQVAEAGRDAAKASEKAALLEKDAAEARLETERVKGLLAWRRISLAQHEQIVTALKGRITEKVWVEFVDTDPEAVQFHGDLWQTMKDAGIDVQWYSGWERAVGVQITNVKRPAGQLVSEAFKRAGIAFVERPEPGLAQAKDVVEIIVGTRPPAFFSDGGRAVPVR